MIILRSATQAQRDHKIIHARNLRVQPQAIMGSGIVRVCCMTSSSGRLADVGDLGWYCLPGVRVNASERRCLTHPFLKHLVVREIQRRRSSLRGKVRKPLQSVQTNHG